MIKLDDVGWLWQYQGKPKNLDDMLTQACECYQRRFGCKPLRVVVHPSMVAGNKIPANGVVLKTSTKIMPSYFWFDLP